MALREQTPCGSWIERAVAEMLAARNQLLIAAEALETISDRTAVITTGARLSVSASLRQVAEALRLASAPF